MFLNRQSTVIQTTLRELLHRNKRETEKAHTKTVLALLFFHMNGMNEGLKGLKELHENNIRVRICPDEHILEHFDVTHLAEQIGIDDWMSLHELELKKEHIDHFYIPILPFSVVTDVLQFNDVRQSIRILLWALMKGKKVSALSMGADPYHSLWKETDMNHGTPFLKHNLNKQLQQLRGYGIQLINHTDDVLPHVMPGLDRNSYQVITANTIKQHVHKATRYIAIEQGTIITPLARDLARKYHIELVKQKEGISHGNGTSRWESDSN